MLQQIILSNSDVFSLPEPWIMLPLIYLIKHDDEGRACYNYRYAQINIERVLGDSSSDHLEAFYRRIRKLALDTYSDLKPGDKRFFLDKTPRYYHILPDLLELFPDAKFIVLLRNPLSIFSSIMEYNFQGSVEWLGQNDRWHDVITAPRNFVEAMNRKNIFIIRYEEIIIRKEKVLKNLFEYLGLNLKNNEINGKYTVSNKFTDSQAIDRKSLSLHNEPVQDYLNSWKKSITNWQKKRILIEYLEYLGEEIITKLGYSYNELMFNVKSISTKWTPLTLSFKELTNNYNQDNIRVLKRIKLRLNRKLYGK